MKKIALILIFTLLFLSLAGCGSEPEAQIAATTAPVWQFTSMLCENTPLTVSRVVTESVSCLHDYTLTVGQMKMLENAELIVVSGAGLEEFMEDVLQERQILDASEGISLLESCEDSHPDDDSYDPHIWLSPSNARLMAQNICSGLTAQYPEYTAVFETNLAELNEQLLKLQSYGEEALADLSCRELITFHDGFAYLADAFDLHIIRAIEEESGSEASARELIELIDQVEQYELPAVFTEVSGSASAAGIICAEAGVESYALDLAMAGDDYFASMYRNIDILKEALK